jgi:predicted nucleotidyltransferase
MNKQIQLQKDLIDKVTSILKKYSSVKAVLLTGSQAAKSNTAFSDIDITVIFKTDQREYAKEIFDEVSNLYPTLSNLYMRYDQECLILFSNGVKLDFLFLKSSVQLDSYLYQSVEALYDPENVTKQKLTEAKQPKEVAKPKWNDAEGRLIDWFFWMFRQIYCYACQAELNKVKSFDKLYMAQQSMHSVREKLLTMIWYVHGSKDYLNNIDDNLAKEFKDAFARLDINEVCEATRRLVNIYARVGYDYCQKESLQFPDKKIKEILELFDEFDSYRTKESS